MRNNEGPEQSGYGIVCYCAGSIIHRYSISLSHRSTVFNVEMYALSHAAMKARSLFKAGDVTFIHFFSDSSSTVSEIVSPLIHPAQLASLIFLSHICYPLFFPTFYFPFLDTGSCRSYWEQGSQQNCQASCQELITHKDDSLLHQTPS